MDEFAETSILAENTREVSGAFHQRPNDVVLLLEGDFVSDGQ